jgi:hypothetical protein
MSGSEEAGERTLGTDWQVVEQRLYDPEGDTGLTAVIIRAVAAAEGVDAMAVREPVLYDVVDAAALKEALFGDERGAPHDAHGGSLSFEYRDHRVTVRGDGWVHVADPTRRLND